MPTVQRFAPPGDQGELELTRDDAGRLVELTGAGRSYLRHEGTERVLGDHLAVVAEVVLPGMLLRKVRTAQGSWAERYRWDEAGRPVWVDGVEVRRDERGRVTGCHGDGASWRYVWAGEHLAVVEGPFGVRHVARGERGRPLRVRVGAAVETLAYDPAGHRRGAARPPAGWHRDPLGRLWTVTGPDGAVLATYLWDGFACLGRVDGPVGAPLAAAFSLDLTCTPVRAITRTGAWRIPRDAYGEALLAHAGVPGLHGGAVHAGLVHFRGRALDPRVGAFCAPDPWHGGETDPRRTDPRARQRALPVERSPGGPYEVCSGDPVGRADPTGEVSVPLILSDLTWSLTNNLVGWLGMEFTLNFWYSILAGKLSWEGLSSNSRSGSFAVAIDGMFSLPNNRAWTYQHIVWDTAGAIDALGDARVLDPKGPFRPTLYGTMLRVTSGAGAPFLLAGTAVTNASRPLLPLAWTRAGGKAEPVVPGSPVPAFPSGGLHFSTVQTGLRSPAAATITELEPTGTLATGAVSASQVRLALAGTGLGLHVGDLVLLTDGAGAVRIVAVQSVEETGGSTSVLLATEQQGLGPAEVRLRALGAALTSESLSVGARPGALIVTGSTGDYVPGAPLRLTQGSVVGAALVDKLEAQLSIDLPVPGGLPAPLTVRLAAADGVNRQATVADATTLDFPAGTAAPGVGQALLVRGASGGSVPVVVTEEVDADTRRVDRDLTAAAAPGSAVTWQRAASGAVLGTRADPPEAGATLTYQPAAPRTAPASGLVRIEGNDGHAALRQVATLAYDVLVPAPSLPGPGSGTYNVQRFPFGGLDRDHLTVEQVTGLTLAPATALDNAVAIQLQQLSGATVSAGAPLLGGGTRVPGAATLTFTPAPGGSRPASPTPSQLVVVTPSGGGTAELAVVKSIRLTLALDRPLPLGAGPLEAVLLSRTAAVSWNAVRVDALQLTVLPSAGGGPTPTQTQLPRLAVGELVEVGWNGAPPDRHQYRVTETDGSTIRLAGDVDVPAGSSGVTVTRLVPADPDTGGSRVGLEGRVEGSDPSGNTLVSFLVWQPSAPATTPAAVPLSPPRPVIGIVDGATTHAAVVADATRIEVELGASPTTGAASLDLAAPVLKPPAGGSVNTAYAATFSRGAGGSVTVPSLALAAGTDLVVAVPFKESARKADGRLHPGSVLVPNDPEGFELDRRESLVEHELTHTLQSALWGQWLLGFVPLGAIEGIIGVTTDMELPEYSAYVPATLGSDGPVRTLTIPDARGIPFAKGDKVQISGARQATVSVELGDADGSKFRLTPRSADLGLVSGEVQVRRRAGGGVLATIDDILQFFTPGGVLTIAAGSLWASLIFGVGHLFYALKNKLFGGAGRTWPASVTDSGASLTVADSAGQEALRGANRVIVERGDATFVRAVASADGATVRLRSPLEVTGDVRVAPYSTHTPESMWDWNDYYPASVPDPSKPAAIRVQPVGDNTLTLQVDDRVQTSSGAATARTSVVAVAADGTVELADPPSLTGAGAGRELRIAKVSSRDPLHGADSVVITETGMGWLRYLFDPYGQFIFRNVQPRGRSLRDILFRIGRAVLSSRAWAIPGYYFFDNLPNQIKKNANNNTTGYLSELEQGASRASGDTYNPMGLLRPGPPQVVGDVCRYWVLLVGGTRSFSFDALVRPGQQDAPGVQLQPSLLLLPLTPPAPDSPPSTPTSPGNEPNLTAAAPATSGLAVPDALSAKAVTPVNGVSSTTPSGFRAAPRGWVPTSPTLQRTAGIYAAFCQPGQHRITVSNGFGSADSGRLAQREGKSTLFFDLTIADVTVTVAGTAVAEGDTVQLVLTQRAAVAVSPSGGRRYAVGLLRPSGGGLLSSDGSLLIAAGTATGGEPVEISRWYAQAPDRSMPDNLAQHGVHLDGDLHVPVRSFRVQVVATIPLRASADPSAAALTDRSPGQDGFLLVPSTLTAPAPRLEAVAYPGPPAPPLAAGAADPSPVIEVVPVPPAAASFVGPGVVLHVSFRAEDPPEEPAELTFAVEVGTSAAHATLRATVRLQPWFTLTPTGGATSYTVARGGTLALDSSGGITPTGVQVTPAGVAASVSGSVITLTADASASPGPRVVIATDAADPTHHARRTIIVT